MKSLKNICLIVFAVFFIHTSAEAQVKTTTEYRVGDFRVISILDVPISMDSKLLIGNKADIKKYVPSGKCEASLNVFLLKSGKELILFDTGLGSFGNGQTVSVLKVAGITADKITKVIFTHLHMDHIGGVMGNGKKVFPNAEIYVPEVELAYWSNRKNMNEGASKSGAANFDAVKNFKQIYGDKIKTFASGEEIMPGLTSLAAYGHTAGHTAYEVSSKDKTMLIWGDIMHCLAAQIANPSISISFDSNPSAAAKTRARVLSEAVDNNYVAGAHLPYPGVINIKKTEDGKYEYTSVKGK